jgi:hypothetical protein
MKRMDEESSGYSSAAARQRESLFEHSTVEQQCPDKRQSLFAGEQKKKHPPRGKSTRPRSTPHFPGEPFFEIKSGREPLPPGQRSRAAQPSDHNDNDDLPPNDQTRLRPSTTKKARAPTRPQTHPVGFEPAPGARSLARECAETQEWAVEAEQMARQEQRQREQRQRERRERAQRKTISPTPRYAAGAPWYTNHYVILAIAIVSIVVILVFWPGGSPLNLSRWNGPLGGAYREIAKVVPFLSPPGLPPGDYSLRGAPSLSASEIDSILEGYGSPATGTGQSWIDLGHHYEIDPAYAVAFFIHESSAGTHPAWAGHKPDGETTHNVGNIICAGYPNCHGRFRDYDSWEEGIEDWYRLIDEEYIKGRGHKTLDDVLPIYAPAVENDVNGYVGTVKRLVDGWRGGFGRGLGSGPNCPRGNPLKAPNTVMTQGYGIGTHAPAHTWGAIDLALDSNNDGAADPEGTANQPVYATHYGIVKTSSNTMPAGNHIWVINDEYKTGYAHLQDFAVTSGQIVQPGDLLGHVGSTGQSSGPHLDYQVWRYEGGGWVNQNPLDFEALSN